MNDLRKCAAEAIGTFYLCFAGIAAICSTGPGIDSGIGLVGIALAHGLALSVAVCTFGGLSGAHFNPAVTCGFLVTGRIKLPLAMKYIGAQLVGAIIAAAICKLVFPVTAVKAVNLGIPLPSNPALPVGTLLLVEFVCTFLLMTSIFGVAVDRRGKAVSIGGFAIGLTVTFDILAAGAITGASMNPARSFGPALIQGDFKLHHWYWIAPIAGAIAAADIYHRFLLKEDDESSGDETA